MNISINLPKDIRQTDKYKDYLTKLGWKVEKITGSLVFIKKIFFFSVIKIQRPINNIPEKDLAKIVKQNNAFAVYIEPINYKELEYYTTKLRFKITKHPFLPSKTIHIALRKTQSQLLADMHHKTRYNIKIAQKREIKVEQSSDIDLFADLWTGLAFKRGMLISLKKTIVSLYNAFGEDSDILLAKKNNKVIAGIFMVSTDKISYYMYAAGTKEGKREYAPTLLAWEAIKLAKLKGKLIFDFEGVYDERFPLKSWKGFSRFKKSFGGEEVEFPPSVKKFYIPFLNKL
jgi:peptidoglycan pentaglycine glycine transferase (the first glycine)